MQISEGWDQGP